MPGTASAKMFSVSARPPKFAHCRFRGTTITVCIIINPSSFFTWIPARWKMRSLRSMTDVLSASNKTPPTTGRMLDSPIRLTPAGLGSFYDFAATLRQNRLPVPVFGEGLVSRVGVVSRWRQFQQRAYTFSRYVRDCSSRSGQIVQTP